MRYHLNVILSIVFCGVFTLPVAAQKIGLLLDSYVLDRWAVDEKYFCEKVTELGGECIAESAYGDAEQQVNIALKMIENGVQAIAVVPTDGKMAGKIVDAAKTKGIPIISYDRLIVHPDVALYVSYDSKKVGQIQAESALKQVEKGNFLLVNGPVSDQNAVLFREGQLEVLKPKVAKGQVKILADIKLDHWGELDAFIKADEFLSDNTAPLDAVIAANDGIATSIINWYGETLPKGLFVTGQDGDIAAVKNLVSGKQGMTVYKPLKPLAYIAAEAAVKLAQGTKMAQAVPTKIAGITIDALLLEPKAVTKDNYKNTMVKDGHLKLAEILEK